MREILFRGKRLDNGKWCFGTYASYESGDACIFSQKFSRYGYEATEICYRHKVDPETVGQFTGLTDKNRKLIFEGDIVNYNNGLVSEIFKVVYNEKYARFTFTKPNTVFAVFDTEKCEVVGNVHDNPELLKASTGEDIGNAAQDTLLPAT